MCLLSVRRVAAAVVVVAAARAVVEGYKERDDGALALGAYSSNARRCVKQQTTDRGRLSVEVMIEICWRASTTYNV